ncbi:MAG: proteasome-activating nucleotidase [Thermoplasmata archaeon]
MDDEMLPLEDRIHTLEAQIKELSEELEQKITENEELKMEMDDLRHEIIKTKAELDRLRATPLIVGNIKDVIDDKRVVVKSSTGPDFIVTYSERIPRSELKNGARVSLNKQTLSVVEVLPPGLDPIVSGAEIIEKPNITYDQIGGLEQQLLEVREAVEFPLLYPDKFRTIGIDPPKGVLIIGPPGTGKTLIAKAVAHHTNAAFIRLVGSELVQKYIGEGARLVRELFELAREKAPSIIFIDEIDSIGSKRMDVSTSGDREVQRTLMQLLAELDGFEVLGNTKIIGATNRPDILDDALLRPGRFDRIIEIPKPNKIGRKSIFEIHLKNIKYNKSSIDIDELVDKTEGATGADIKAIVTEAGMFAIRANKSVVSMEDFRKATEKVMNHYSQPNAKEREKNAYMFH